MTLIIIALIMALLFEYINGFHDTANTIATSVSTKILTPRQAIILAAVCNMIGAMWGTQVATTIGKGLVATSCLSIITILSALTAAIIWNLLTWWLGLPSSSSHALIGGLCGSALAFSDGPWRKILLWSTQDPVTHKLGGILHKVIIPMVVAPMLGIIMGFLVMFILMVLLRKVTPRTINQVFGKLQLISAGIMGIGHGTNDAQKTMGILALILYTGTTGGAFNDVPNWLAFLRTPEFTISFWVKVTCAIIMAAGTAAGGWRIIKTLGHKMVRLQPIHGFAAQTTSAAIILAASHVGMPLSTTHVISTSIMGVGATKRLSAVKWGIVGNVIAAWVLTIPMTLVLGYVIQYIVGSFWKV